MPQKPTYSSNRFLQLLFLILTFNCAYSQYIFDETNIPEKISLHPYTLNADTGSQELSVHINTIDVASGRIQKAISFDSMPCPKRSFNDR